MVFLGAVCLTPPGLYSQTSSSTQSLPPGFVDGSKNPDLIPDYASYRLVLIHLSAILNSTDVRAASRKSVVFGQIGLSSADSQVLTSFVSTFSASYAQWQSQAGIVPSTAADEAARSLVLATRDALIKALTADGVQKLVLYVQAEKTHMVVRP
jgi:hypothetical protein